MERMSKGTEWTPLPAWGVGNEWTRGRVSTKSKRAQLRLCDTATLPHYDTATTTHTQPTYSSAFQNCLRGATLVLMAHPLSASRARFVPGVRRHASCVSVCVRVCARDGKGCRERCEKRVFTIWWVLSLHS